MSFYCLLPGAPNNIGPGARCAWHKFSSRGQISSKFSLTFSQVPETPNEYLLTSEAVLNPRKIVIRFDFFKVVFKMRDVTFGFEKHFTVLDII